MTKIRPFKALRPVRDKVHLVATRPYYSYKKNVLTAKLEDNPFTFLHIINPEFRFDKNGVNPPPSFLDRFDLVKESYNEFRTAGVLIQDSEPSIYVYRQSTSDHVYTGVIAGASVAEYLEDTIKKHEATITAREKMFTDYLEVVGYNAEPVLISYPHQPALEKLLDAYTLKRSEYEFTTTDRIKHELWVLTKNESQAVQKAFEAIPSTYIADGHHRSASSVRLAQKKKDAGQIAEGNKDFFLACFIDETKLNILQFNRLVKTTNGLTKEELIDRLHEYFVLSSISTQKKPTHEHEITMFIDDAWYQLNCKPNIIDNNHPVKCLDAEILTNFVLTPILGIKDLKSDENIEFVSGAEPIEKFETKITSGKFKVGFVLYPVSIEQVKRVADNQLIMPPKSTWVEPKLRSGLTIYDINQ
jgi:uncharacterized protein (DUF1015 family)